MKAQYPQSILCLHSQSRDMYSKTCLKRPLKRRPKIVFQDRLSLNAVQQYGYCRMLQGEHSAILSTCIKLPSVIKIFVLSIFEWPLKTSFTVLTKRQTRNAMQQQSLLLWIFGNLCPCKFQIHCCCFLKNVCFMKRVD